MLFLGRDATLKQGWLLDLSLIIDATFEVTEVVIAAKFLQYT